MGKGLLLIPKFKRKNFCPGGVVMHKPKVSRAQPDPVGPHEVRTNVADGKNSLFWASRTRREWDVAWKEKHTWFCEL